MIICCSLLKLPWWFMYVSSFFTSFLCFCWCLVFNLLLVGEHRVVVYVLCSLCFCYYMVLCCSCLMLIMLLLLHIHCVVDVALRSSCSFDAWHSSCCCYYLRFIVLLLCQTFIVFCWCSTFIVCLLLLCAHHVVVNNHNPKSKKWSFKNVNVSN